MNICCQLVKHKFIGFFLCWSILVYFTTLFTNPPSNPSHKTSITSMDFSTNSIPESEIAQQFLFFNVYKDGRVHVLSPPVTILPAADDPITGVKTKDVQISPDVSARIFLPKLPDPSDTTTTKLPLLLYIHGGGFCMLSAFSAEYTHYLTDLVAKAQIIAVSVEYGLFPTRPIPACYEDSWAALQWVATHATGSGPDPWINNHANLKRIYIAGDSAGGNIAHTLAARVGSIGLGSDVRVSGMILIHPYFGEDDKMWMYMCPTNVGPRDPRMRPAVEDLARVGCKRVLVIVAENDVLRDAGKGYAEELMESGWKGTVEIVENQSRDHCFHLANPHDDVAAANQHRIVSFIHQG